MLLCVEDATRGEVGQECSTRRRCTAFVVSDRLRLKSDLPTGSPDAAAQILVLAVEEEALVESAELFENGPADEHAGARDPFGRRGGNVLALVTYHLVDPGSSW